MPVQLAIGEILEPLRADPTGTALLFDVDGTLAPIVRHPADAQVPDDARRLLVELARRYGTVACVSGRPAAVARQIVGIGSIAYIGNHGCELLAASATDVVLDRRVAAYAERVGAFARGADTPALQALRVRREDKGPIAAFHWRGAPDEAAAIAAIDRLEQDALVAGFVTRRGRKVLEVRPPVPIDKGRGIVSLLARPRPAAGLYAGDDVTDVDAFRGLRELVGAAAVCVAVRSEESPEELLREADVSVDGTAGVIELLGELLR